jgi:hypothetical protein
MATPQRLSWGTAPQQLSWGMVRCRRAPTDVITAMCSSTNAHRHSMPPTIEAAVLTAVVLVSDTGYIGLLVDTDQPKPADDHQALEPVITFYTTGAPPIHELQHRLLDECDLSLDPSCATRTRRGGYGRCLSTVGQTALIMVQPVHYTGSFIGGVHNQAPDCTSHTISQSVGCTIVWYNQATICELLPNTPEDMPWLKLCNDLYTDLCTPHSERITASGQLSYVQNVDLLFQPANSSTDGTGHDLSAAVAARGAQIASLHSTTPAPRTHEHNTANDTTSTATPGNPRPAKDNDMASIGENEILQQLAALRQQMAGFSTTVSSSTTIVCCE